MADLYRLLGISRRADGASIKATYYQLAKQYHPDANAGVEANARFREIQGAYETLGNPVARAEYDLEQAGQRSRARKSFVVGALAGLSTLVLVLMLSMLPALVNRGEPVPTPITHATRTDEQVATAMSSKDMNCEEVIKADLAFRAVDGPPQSLPLVSCTAESAPSVETRTQGLAYLERELEELAYERAMREPDPPRASSMTTQSASLEVEPEPAIKTQPARWALLENAGAGFELKYPADVFAPKPGALEADDRLFVSQDGHAVLRVYANRSSPATAPSKYRASLLAKRYAGASLDYAPQRENWFVLSGTLGQEMFYERVTFSCDRRSFHGWLITYPVVERQLYDAVVEEMHRTYRYGKAAGWRCGDAGPAVDGVRRLNPEPDKSNKASVLSP